MSITSHLKKTFGIILLFSLFSVCPLIAEETGETRAQAQTDQVGAFVECWGSIEPGQRYVLALMPGEQVAEMMVHEGMAVTEGMPIVQLANDALVSRFLSLKEIQTTLESQADQVNLLKTKIALMNEDIDRLTGRIDAEERIHGDVPNYLVGGELTQWDLEKKQKENELLIKKKELELLESRSRDRLAAMRNAENSLKILETQMDGLLVRAPFSGRVVNLHPFPTRAASGEKILELWNDTNLKARAEIWQNQLQYVRPGLETKIFPDFFNGSFIWGSVQSVGTANVLTKPGEFPTFPLVIDLKNPPPDLKVGMTVSIRILNSGPNDDAKNE